MLEFSGRNLGSSNTYSELWYAYFADQTAVDYVFPLEKISAIKDISYILNHVDGTVFRRFVDLQKYPLFIINGDPDMDRWDASFQFNDLMQTAFVTDLSLHQDVDIVFSVIITLSVRGLQLNTNNLPDWFTVYMKNTFGHEDVLSGVGYNRAVLGHYIVSWSDRLDVNVVQDTPCTGVLFYKSNNTRRINVSVNYGMLLYDWLLKAYARPLDISSNNYLSEYEPLTILNTIGYFNINANIIIHFSNHTPIDTSNGANYIPLITQTDKNDSIFWPESYLVKLNSDFLRNNLLHCIPTTHYVFYLHHGERDTRYTFGGWPAIPYFCNNIQEDIPNFLTSTYYKLQIINMYNLVHSFGHIPSMVINYIPSTAQVDLDLNRFAFSYDGTDFLTSPVEYYKIYLPKPISTSTTTIDNNGYAFSMILSGNIDSKEAFDFGKLIKPIFIMNKDGTIHANYKYYSLRFDENTKARWDNKFTHIDLLDELRFSEVILNETADVINQGVRNNSIQIYGGITHVNFYTAYPFMIFALFEDYPYENVFYILGNFENIFKGPILNSHYPLIEASSSQGDGVSEGGGSGDLKYP